MLALCLMLLVTYYALNYAGIIGLGLAFDQMDLNDVAKEFVRRNERRISYFENF